MTLMPERSSLGSKTYELIRSNRNKIGEACIEPLDKEFPYINKELQRKFGATGLFLVRAGDNEAGTFKIRGAFAGAAALKNQGYSHIRLASAGNHARGAIIAARELDFTEVNVGIPETAPYDKREGLYRLWPTPHLHIHPIKGTYDDAFNWIYNRPSLGALLPAYDDAHVIAGQGTLVDDILTTFPEVDIIVMPVGGGGLLAGVRQRLDELGQQHTITYGVEAEGSNSSSKSQKAGKLVAIPSPNQSYGGSAVRQIGQLPFEIIRAAGQRVQFVTANERYVEHIVGLYQRSRQEFQPPDRPAYEPTSLVAIAGLEKIIKRHEGAHITVIGTGHNAPLPHV